MSGDLITCKVCGFVGYAAEVKWHEPHCRPPKPWIVFDPPGFDIIRRPDTGAEPPRVKP